jgi:hypothetical protein
MSLVAGVRWAARGTSEFPAGTPTMRNIPPTRVRIEGKYGRARGRRLVAIQRGPAAQPMFRQALLAYDAGSLSSKRDPFPTSDSSRSSPPRARASPRAIGRPSPVPDPSRV